MGFFSKIKPNWTGALATGLGYLAGGVPGAIIGGAIGTYQGNADKEAKKKQNRLNQQQAILQNQYAKQNWDLTNAYNDPKAQMERLKAAGLNPNLVYGGGNVTGNSAGLLSANAVGDQLAYNRADSLSKSLPILQGFANLRNTNTQNELLNYQMGQTAAQTDSIREGILMSNAQRAHLNLSDLALKHNLDYARRHGLPVNSVPGISSSIGGALNFVGEQFRRTYAKNNGYPSD